MDPFLFIYLFIIYAFRLVGPIVDEPCPWYFTFSKYLPFCLITPVDKCGYCSSFSEDKLVGSLVAGILGSPIYSGADCIHGLYHHRGQA